MSGRDRERSVRLELPPWPWPTVAPEDVQRGPNFTGIQSGTTVAHPEPIHYLCDECQHGEVHAPIRWATPSGTWTCPGLST